jgi:hypothetical protein
MEILEGRDYGMTWRLNWYRDDEVIPVRVVHIMGDEVEVKVLTQDFETLPLTPSYPFDYDLGAYPHITVVARRLVCPWEDIDRYTQEQRHIKNARVPPSWSGGNGHKRKWRKWHGLRSELSWAGRNKYNRHRANRKTRHQPIDPDQ